MHGRPNKSCLFRKTHMDWISVHKERIITNWMDLILIGSKVLWSAQSRMWRYMGNHPRLWTTGTLAARSQTPPISKYGSPLGCISVESTSWHKYTPHELAWKLLQCTPYGLMKSFQHPHLLILKYRGRDITNFFYNKSFGQSWLKNPTPSTPPARLIEKKKAVLLHLRIHQKVQLHSLLCSGLKVCLNRNLFISCS